MIIPVLLLALSASGEATASPQNTPAEVYDGVKVTDAQIQDVKSKAVQAFAGEIERIHVGQLKIVAGGDDHAYRKVLAAT